MQSPFLPSVPCEYTMDNAGSLSAANPRPCSVTFAGEPDCVFRINFDTRTVELNDGVEWDDAAKTFWDYVLRSAPPGFKLEKDNA